MSLWAVRFKSVLWHVVSPQGIASVNVQEAGRKERGKKSKSPHFCRCLSCGIQQYFNRLLFPSVPGAVPVFAGTGNLAVSDVSLLVCSVS